MLDPDKLQKGIQDFRRKDLGEHKAWTSHAMQKRNERRERAPKPHDGNGKKYRTEHKEGEGKGRGFVSCSYQYHGMRHP